jgi:hypothetical protein
LGAVLANQIYLLQHAEKKQETNEDAGLIGKTARKQKCVIVFLTSEAQFFI